MRLKLTNHQVMTKFKGFTLIEVLVVIAILAILVSLAAPSFTTLIRSNVMSSNVNSFLADIRYARSEAIRRGGSVVMCRSDLPEATTPSCGSGSGPGGNGWVSGWIIFFDADDNGTYSATESLLRVQGAIKNMNSIVNSSTKLVFTATGRLKSLSAGADSYQFGSAPDFPNTAQRMVCISVGGRSRIAGDGYASCP